MYSVSFTVTRRTFCVSLDYNGANSSLFVDGKEIVKFKAEDFAIVATPLCLGNISNDWSVDNMKRTGLTGYVYEFSVDCDVFVNSADVNKSMSVSHSYSMFK